VSIEQFKLESERAKDKRKSRFFGISFERRGVPYGIGTTEVARLVAKRFVKEKSGVSFQRFGTRRRGLI
jgi:hypothetical protein